MAKPITIQPQWVTLYVPNVEYSPYVSNEDDAAVLKADAAVNALVEQCSFDEQETINADGLVPAVIHQGPSASGMQLLLDQVLFFGVDDLDVCGDRCGVPVKLQGTEMRVYIGIDVALMLRDLKRKRISTDATLRCVEGEYQLQ